MYDKEGGTAPPHQGAVVHSIRFFRTFQVLFSHFYRRCLVFNSSLLCMALHGPLGLKGTTLVLAARSTQHAAHPFARSLAAPFRHVKLRSSWQDIARNTTGRIRPIQLHTIERTGTRDGTRDSNESTTMGQHAKVHPKDGSFIRLLGQRRGAHSHRLLHPTGSVSEPDLAPRPPWHRDRAASSAMPEPLMERVMAVYRRRRGSRDVQRWRGGVFGTAPQ